MSTKIYNGLIVNLRGMTQIAAMNAVTDQVKEVAERSAIRAYEAELAIRYRSIMDALDVGVSLWPGEAEVMKCYAHKTDPAVAGFYTAKHMVGDRFMPEGMDPTIHIIFFPISRGRILALLNCHSRRVDAYMDIDDVTSLSEYGYWDNADQPDDMPDAKWATRCRHWEEAIPGFALNSGAAYERVVLSRMDMLQITLDEKYFVEQRDKFRLDCASIEKRINSVFPKYKDEVWPRSDCDNDEIIKSHIRLILETTGS